MKLIRCFVLSLMLTPAFVASQDFDAGLRAYNSGDYAAALREWRPLAEQGFTGAQNNLGTIYEHGLGVAQDYAEAVRWYRAAAKHGFASAQNNLAFMYQHGRGVTQDYAEAVRWFRAAAEQGYASAQNNLGFMYQHGLSVAQDYVTARMWLYIAAANGSEAARESINTEVEGHTAEAIIEAQRRARVCMASDYQDCD